MEDYFIIPHSHIDEAWNPPDRSLEFFVLEYCEEALDIPLYLIKDACYSDEGLEVELMNLEPEVAAEDWYTNLFRLSSYAKAS